jgi:hypothetical protein
MNKAQIEKQWGQVGLIRFGIKDNIPFTPISLQGIKQNKSYEYNPKESLFMNILRYSVLAGTFTTEEIRYVFGKNRHAIWNIIRNFAGKNKKNYVVWLLL